MSNKAEITKKTGKKVAASSEQVPIFVMGKRYDVPPSLTIMKAMEWAGYTLVRGAGCRGGFCGACATVYRIKGDPKLYFGLACQSVVQPEMYLGQIPFFPAGRANYDVANLDPVAVTLFQTYPETLRCLGCGACNKACPQELDVKGYMAAAMRGCNRKRDSSSPVRSQANRKTPSVRRFSMRSSKIST